MSQPPNSTPENSATKPEDHLKYGLEEYRQFIRDAAPFVSLVAGRKIRSQDADTLTDDEMRALALLIDKRAAALNKNIRSSQS